MSSDPEVERCLRAIREQARSLADDVTALSPEACNGPTNCPPWRVRDLVAHVVASGEGFKLAVERGLVGITDPPQTAEAREHRQAELAAADPAVVAGALDGIVAAFEALYAGLDESGLAAIGYHRRGNRPARWFAYHRLAEVAFHHWDYQQSLGRAASFDDDVAALLLPTLLESNAPRTYAAGLSAARGTGERYLLAVAGDPSARWLVTIGPEQLDARRGDAPADVTITGPASALALLIYGRGELGALSQAGILRVTGDSAVAARFPEVFPRP